jgi:hypothetical protein
MPFVKSLNLMKDVNVERIHRTDRQTLNIVLASFEDTMTETVRVAWDIAKSEYTDPKARMFMGCPPC